MPNIEPDDQARSAIAPETVHVSVAVIAKKGKILISRRADHVHQGGLWEFPGGKVECDETIDEALEREIQEELGIHINNSRPLIKLLHHYPDKSVLLETRLVTDFGGKEYSQDKLQTGLEGQAVKWVAIETLGEFQFPAANKPIINAVQLPETYAITPDFASDNFVNELYETVKRHRLLQLRIKSLSGKQLDSIAKHACEIALANNSRMLLNSAMSISDDVHHLASGLHLTAAHLHEKGFAERYRQQFPEKLIAASCHNQADIERANKLGLDFMVISPVQHTTSHPDQNPLGWGQFQLLTEFAKIPVFALGGMAQEDIAKAQEHGAQGIAAISSLWNSND